MNSLLQHNFSTTGGHGLIRRCFPGQVRPSQTPASVKQTKNHEKKSKLQASFCVTLKLCLPPIPAETHTLPDVGAPVCMVCGVCLLVSVC